MNRKPGKRAAAKSAVVVPLHGRRAAASTDASPQLSESAAQARAGVRPCTRVYALLVVLTFVTWLTPGLGLSERALVLTVLGIALVKAQLVVDFFMNLRPVRGFWRPLLAGYLLLLGALISFAFLATGAPA